MAELPLPVDNRKTKAAPSYVPGPFRCTFKSGQKCWYRAGKVSFSAENWSSLAEEMSRRDIAVERSKPRGAGRLLPDALEALNARFGEATDDGNDGGGEPVPEAAEEAEAREGESPAAVEAEAREGESPAAVEEAEAREGEKKKKRRQERPVKAKASSSSSGRPKAPAVMPATPKTKASPRPGPRCPSPTLATSARPSPRDDAPPDDTEDHLTGGEVDVEAEAEEANVNVEAEAEDAPPDVSEEHPPGDPGADAEAEGEQEDMKDPSKFETHEESEEDLFSDLNNIRPKAKRRCLEAAFFELMALEMPQTPEMTAALEKAGVAMEAGRVTSFANLKYRPPWAPRDRGPSAGQRPCGAEPRPQLPSSLDHHSPLLIIMLV